MPVLKVSWRFVAGVVVAVLAAGVLFALLRPALPSQGHLENASYSNYREGGARCDPARLARLKGMQAEVEGDRCAEAAEEHRLKSEDLEQQTRSADAAEEMAGLTYRQTVMMAAGTSIGLLTLVAAFFAVLYARKAGEEARRAASAAEGQLVETTKVSAAELRPYVFVDRIEVQRSEHRWTVGIKLKNFGKLPARALLVQHDVYFTSFTETIRKDVFKKEKARFPVVAPSVERTAYSYPAPTKEELEAFDSYRGGLIIRLRYWYRGTMRTYAERADFLHDWESIVDAKPYIVVATEWNEHVTSEPNIPNLLDGKPSTEEEA